MLLGMVNAHGVIEIKVTMKGGKNARWVRFRGGIVQARCPKCKQWSTLDLSERKDAAA